MYVLQKVSYLRETSAFLFLSSRRSSDALWARTVRLDDKAMLTEDDDSDEGWRTDEDTDSDEGRLTEAVEDESSRI